MSDTLSKEHEAFKNRLVEDVLGKSGSDGNDSSGGSGGSSSTIVSMEKVVMIIWLFRDDPSVVTFMARFVAKYTGSKHVFDGIEFYLPQLAHMIIHLEVEWDDTILERFALVVCQQSLHFALQLNWILQGAKEDYHPELQNNILGAPNPNYNPTVYSRCCTLIKNIERCVIYGKPRTAELQRLYEKGKISKEEMILLEQADRRFNALQIVNNEGGNGAGGGTTTTTTTDGSNSGAGMMPSAAAAAAIVDSTKLDGWVLIQYPEPRTEETPPSAGPSSAAGSMLSRYCVLDKSVLNCYQQKGACSGGGSGVMIDGMMMGGFDLDRAFSLEEAVVADSYDNDNELCISITTPIHEIKISFNVNEERVLWFRRLTEEAEIHTGNSMHGLTTTKKTKTPVWVQDLTPAQRLRYEFFTNERRFIKNLTDIAEDLRFTDRTERKKVAPSFMEKLSIPNTVYLPLCNSSDIWRRVSSTLAFTTKVFNTKERCPVVMNFLSKRGEYDRGQNKDPNLDVAEYMHSYLEHSSGSGGNNNHPNSILDQVDEEEDDDDDDQEEDEDNNDNNHGEEEKVTVEVQLNGVAGDGDADNLDKNGIDSITGVVVSASDHVHNNTNKNGTDRTTTSSNVWQDEAPSNGGDNNNNETPTNKQRPEMQPQSSILGLGNLQVQHLLRESVIMPIKLANRLRQQGGGGGDGAGAGGGAMGGSHAAISMQGGGGPIRQNSLSVMDRQTQMQPSVPILDGSNGRYNPTGADDMSDNVSVGDGQVVAIQRSSIRFKDQIVLGLDGTDDDGGIDIECINRAKQYICGGELFSEKTGKWLKDIKEQQEQEEESTNNNSGHDENDGDNDDNNNNNNNNSNNVQLEIASCLAKSNDDLRQEVFVMQMIHYYKSLFVQAGLPLWLKTYRILSTSSTTGLLEFLTDATSLDGLKKSEGYPQRDDGTGLRTYFEMVYGTSETKAFRTAQMNFVRSLAAYGIVSYLLGLKDRHNGNIMIDTRGHLIFIDFGFAMGMAPGHEFSMERAPFKLTKEFVILMDGVNSDVYKEFERLFVEGLMAARNNSQIALGLVEIMMYKSNYPCFSGWRYGNGIALRKFEKRLLLHIPDHLVKRKAMNLIRQSKQHFGTYLYDVFQKATNGYEI